MKACAGALVLIGLVALVAPLAGEAQPPIRIGASASKTGTYAALGQNQLRGYELCVKHANEKGGLLGRKLDLVVEDDQSQAATAVRIYERLITQEKVDLLLGPFGAPMTEPVAAVNEKHRIPMVAATGATTSYFRGRKFIFMVLSTSDVYLEGFVDIAARQGLKTIVLINEDSLFSPRPPSRAPRSWPGSEASGWSWSRRTPREPPISPRS